jgi:hypothetical protein
LFQEGKDDIDLPNCYVFLKHWQRSEKNNPQLKKNDLPYFYFWGNYITSPLSKKKLGCNPFTINLYFNSSQYYPTLDKTLAIKLSLHLICFIIRMYSCNINPHLVNLWFIKRGDAIYIYYILSSNKGIFAWPIWPEVSCLSINLYFNSSQ